MDNPYNQAQLAKGSPDRGHFLHGERRTIVRGAPGDVAARLELSFGKNCFENGEGRQSALYCGAIQYSTPFQTTFF
jgi:hypothetical protein